MCLTIQVFKYIKLNNFFNNNKIMNNMNNFGMNPIGMNNMGMNPVLMNNMGMNPMMMNNIGINNQSNIIDENALRIKNIIQPYENKIKELEEILY